MEPQSLLVPYGLPRRARPARCGSCPRAWPGRAPRRPPATSAVLAARGAGHGGDAEARGHPQRRPSPSSRGNSSASIAARTRSASWYAPSRSVSGQDDGQLLAAVAGRLVDLARGLAQHPRHLAQDEVALLVAVGVVDCLKSSMSSMTRPSGWPKRRARSTSAVDDLLEAPVVEQARQLVGHGLALDQSRAGRRSRSRPPPGWRGSGTARARRSMNGSPSRATEIRPTTVPSPEPNGCASAAWPSCSVSAGPPGVQRERLDAADRLVEGAHVARGRHAASGARPAPRATSPGPPRRRRRRPPSRRRSPGGASRSRFDAAVSPMRRIDSCRRARSARSSSRRASSWPAMVLNSWPSSANSSSPSVGHVVEKSPPPSRRAASRKPPICDCSERDTSRAKLKASEEEAERMRGHEPAAEMSADRRPRCRSRTETCTGRRGSRGR